MPEGPEIYYLSTLLKQKLTNLILTEIKANNIKYDSKNNPDVRFENLPNNINEQGYKILDVGCKGKLLWLYICGNKHNENKFYIHIHMGLTGWLKFDRPYTNANIKYELCFKNTQTNDLEILYMEDKIKLSKINLYNEYEHNVQIYQLGIDIFSNDFTLEIFKNIIQDKKMILASLLLKQDIICGIGNYIKNEALYIDGLKLKPDVKTSELTEEQINKLYNNILIVSYSNLYTMLSNSNILKYLDENKLINLPDMNKLIVPYEYQIYKCEYTIDGYQVYKTKISGRDSYYIKI